MRGGNIQISEKKLDRSSSQEGRLDLLHVRATEKEKDCGIVFHFRFKISTITIASSGISMLNRDMRRKYTDMCDDIGVVSITGRYM